MKKILLFGLLIAVVGIGIGYMIYNKPHKNMASAKADYTLDAKVLVAEFSSDEAAANEKYLGKIITVTGSVAEVTTDDNGNPSVMLDTGDPMAAVKCNLDFASKPKRTEFQTGETVTLKGDCSGFIELTGVILDRCVEQ
ncbi:MAG: hypothetical protein AAB316_04305 [Bacteroidota bacterium]